MSRAPGITPLTPPTAEVDASVARLAELQDLASSAPLRAQAELRSWFSALGRSNDHHTLGLLIARGEEPQHLDGPTQGEMLGRLGGTAQVRLAGRLQHVGESLGMGWRGKTFDGPSTGFNRLTRRSVLPMRIISLGYRCMPLDDSEVMAFRFHHSIEESAVVPGLQVRSIRYDDPEFANPMVLHRTRDEVAQLAPGCFLGQALMREAGVWNRIGFFTAFVDPRRSS